MPQSFPPHHLIHNPGVALDNLHHFGGDVFLHVVRHGDADVAVSVHLHGGIHGLEEAVRIDACQDKATLVQSFRSLRGGTDAHRRKRVPHAGEEAALLGQGAAVADHGEGVHLQAVVVMETFMFAPSKDTKKSAQTSGYIDGSYSSPLTLGENELEMQVTVKNGKPQSAALKHLDKTVKTMYPLVESSLKEINKQLPKVKNIDDIEFDDQSQYTSTILKQAMKNALKKAQE